MNRHIPKEFVDELLAKVDIVQIIDNRVTLKKAGTNYSACCPFHSEKTPSFTVSHQKQFYYCFGCGAHGNAIGFLMNYDRLEFVEAIEELASHLGIPIPQEYTDSLQQPQTGLYELLEKSAHYYQTQLSQSQNAQAYLKSRGLTNEIIQHFRIGFAAQGWDNLLRHCGHSPALKNQLLETGMLIKNEQGKIYDRFRHRLMIPIKDSRGRIIGFGGRSLDNVMPKYLNSPETPLFHKGNELYGLHDALHAHSSLARILVVEGYMDVIALHQFGITQSVATLGTATNPKHLQRLFRHTTEIIFCFDGDTAGQEAAWRALEVSLPVLQDGLQIRFMFLPKNEDPDSLIRKEGTALFQQRIATALPLADFLLQRLCQQVNLHSIDGKAKLASLSKGLVNKIRNSVFQQLIIEKLASLVGMTASTFSAYVFNESSSLPLTSIASPIKSTPLSTSKLLPPVQLAIALLLQYPQLAQNISLPPSLIDIKIAGVAIFIKLFNLAQTNPTLSTGGLLEYCRGSKILEQLAGLAARELIIPSMGVQAELIGAIEKIIRLNRDQQIQSLMHKSSHEGLNIKEKQHLLQLLKERH